MSSRQDEYRRERPEHYGERDDEQQARRLGERENDERYRRERESRWEGEGGQGREQRSEWTREGQPGRERGYGREQGDWRYGREQGRQERESRESYGREQGRGRENYGRYDDQYRQGTWGGSSWRGRESDYPQGGYSRETWPQGGYGQQSFNREHYGREPFGRSGAGSYGTGYESEGFGGSQGRGFQQSGYQQREGQSPYPGQGGYYPGGGYQGGQYQGGGFQTGQYQGGQYGRSGWSPGYESRYGGSQGGGHRDSFFGRGPSNYERSDERIREDICERLTEHPGIDASGVEVFVEQREVTLRGEVDDREQKRMAEDVVEFTPGVRDVHNHIKSRDGGLFGLFRRRDRDRDDDRGRDSRGGTEFSTGQGSTMRGMSGSRSMPNTPTAGIGGEIGSSAGTATGELSKIHEGMEVLGADGQRIGRVKEVRGSEFLLDRPRKKDLLVPRTAISQISDTSVTLRYNSDQIDDLGWDRTLMESGSQQRR